MDSSVQKTPRVLLLQDEENDRSWPLTVRTGTQGPAAIDVRDLYARSGYFTYDPGYGATSSCSSGITYIDGSAGILMHRGYRIEDLAEHCDFLEVCHLLLHGDLPDGKQRRAFDKDIAEHVVLPEQVDAFYRGFAHNAHPMSVMLGVVGALASFYHDPANMRDPEQHRIASYRLIAKMPTIAAMTYQYTRGRRFVPPDPRRSYAENFLYMAFAAPNEEYKMDPVVVEAIDRIFILHADHEQNASTSTVRTAGSSGANPFACIAAGMASLWGPAHGGANEAVIRMLREIERPSRISHYIDRAKDREDSFRLMGFGHRVYKNYDPRATVLRKSCRAVFERLKVRDSLLSLAMELEQRALSDSYFQERKLFPNVDFYSGILLRALGFPESMFTVLFAVARTVGWTAQWMEMLADPEQRIYRPRQLYVGSTERPFVSLEQRSAN